jgi:hypothetical protein
VQPSKIRSRRKAPLTHFSSELTAGLRKPLRNFVGEMLFGIQANQDVKRSNLARSLQEEIPLLKTEDRLWRNLQAEELETHLRQGRLRLGRRRVETNTVLCLDLRDVRKEYARKMEFLDQVWDGSAGEVHAGYWRCSVTRAAVQGSELTPLYQQLFSLRAQDFVSENQELLSAIDPLRAPTRGRGIGAMDRGGDRRKLLEPLLERRERLVIRSTGKRLVLDRRRHRVTIYLTGWKIEETFRIVKPSYPLEGIRVLRYQRLKNLVLLMTPAAYFATAFWGQKLKLKILCEKLLIISQRFFGIPPFRFYALADGIHDILSRSSPSPPTDSLKNLQLELLLGGES